jgi:hypothetical protein
MHAQPLRTQLAGTRTEFDSHYPSSPPFKKTSVHFDFDCNALGCYTPKNDVAKRPSTPPPTKSVHFQTDAPAIESRKRKLCDISSHQHHHKCTESIAKPILCKNSRYSTSEEENCAPNMIMTRRSLESFMNSPLGYQVPKKRPMRLSDDFKLLLYLQRPDLDRQFRLAELIVQTGLKKNCNLPVHLKICTYYLDNIYDEQIGAPCGEGQKKFMRAIEQYVRLKHPLSG